MNREYFTIKLTKEIDLGVALKDMTTAVQFETKNICAVPGVAEFWHGVVNYQGGLLWVLDSDRFFMQSLRTQSVPVVEDDDLSRSLQSRQSHRDALGVSRPALCGETPALDSICGQVLCFNGGNLSHGTSFASRNGLSRKTALHRFFECSVNQKQSPKLTAIIVRNQIAGDRKRVAIATPQLKGIVAVEPTELSSLADKHTSRLHQCCSAVVQTAATAIYLIDSATLLQEIHQ